MGQDRDACPILLPSECPAPECRLVRTVRANLPLVTPVRPPPEDRSAIGMLRLNARVAGPVESCAFAGLLHLRRFPESAHRFLGGHTLRRILADDCRLLEAGVRTLMIAHRQPEIVPRDATAPTSGNR